MQEKFSPLLLASLCVSLIHAGLSIYHFEVCENGLFLAIYKWMRSFYQDRFRTNIGENSKLRPFSQVMVRKESSGANERMKNAASFIAPFLLAWKSESFCLEDRLGTNGKETAADSAEKTAAFFVTGIWLTACSPYGVLVVLARAAQATAVIFGSALMFCAYKGQGLGFMIALMLVFSCLVCESGMRECLSFLCLSRACLGKASRVSVPVPSLSWQIVVVFHAWKLKHTHNCRVCFLQVVNLGETHRAIYVQLSSPAAASCLRSVTKPSKQATESFKFWF
jgi:hypothetical protein